MREIRKEIISNQMELSSEMITRTELLGRESLRTNIGSSNAEGNLNLPRQEVNSASEESARRNTIWIYDKRIARGVRNNLTSPNTINQEMLNNLPGRIKGEVKKAEDEATSKYNHSVAKVDALKRIEKS